MATDNNRWTQMVSWPNFKLDFLTPPRSVDSLNQSMTVVAEPSSRKRNPRNLILAIGLITMAVIGFFVLWNNGLRDRLFPKNFGVVEPGQLYRSGQISRWQIEPTLRNHHIQSIVALSAHSSARVQADVDAEIKLAGDLGIERNIFPLGGDGTGQIEQYAAAIAAIDKAKKAGKPVLVHCIAGAQRTGGVIATYQMLVENKPADEAFIQMKNFGHDPTANPHLLQFLNSHMAELAQKLVDRHVIDRVPAPLPVLKTDD